MLNSMKELELIMDPIQLTTKETLQVNILNNTKEQEHTQDNMIVLVNNFLDTSQKLTMLVNTQQVMLKTLLHNIINYLQVYMKKHTLVNTQDSIKRTMKRTMKVHMLKHTKKNTLEYMKLIIQKLMQVHTTEYGKKLMQELIRKTILVIGTKHMQNNILVNTLLNTLSSIQELTRQTS